MSNAWLFQGNPDRFDMDAFFAGGRLEFRWLTRQHANDIRSGDRVFMWRSKGRSDPTKSGVVGEAVVTGPMERGPVDADAQPSWRSPKDRSMIAYWTPLKLTAPVSGKRFVRRSVIEGDATLANLSILRMSRQTNYELSANEARRLDDLWRALPVI